MLFVSIVSSFQDTFLLQGTFESYEIGHFIIGFMHAAKFY